MTSRQDKEYDLTDFNAMTTGSRRSQHPLPRTTSRVLRTRVPTPLGHVRVELLFTEDAIIANIPDETPDADSLISVIRRWLDLDADIVRIKCERPPARLAGRRTVATTASNSSG